MALTAIVSSTSVGAASATSLLSAVGVGAGGIFVVAALVLLLATLDVVDVSERVDERAQRAILAMVLPLGITFAAIVTFHSLQVLGAL